MEEKLKIDWSAVADFQKASDLHKRAIDDVKKQFDDFVRLPTDASRDVLDMAIDNVLRSKRTMERIAVAIASSLAEQRRTMLPADHEWGMKRPLHRYEGVELTA